MLRHAAHVVDPRVLHALLDAWSGARTTGTVAPLLQTIEAAAEERRQRARTTRVELGADEARALATEAARAIEEHLVIALATPRPLEDVQRLRRLAERSGRARELRAPAFLLDDVGASAVTLLDGWRRGDEALHAGAEERPASPRDLRWLPPEVVAVATAIGHEEIGLDEEANDLELAQDFYQRHPSAGTFWDVHGTGGPDDALERFPHPIWDASPLALPIVLESGGSPVRASERAGPARYVDAKSIARFTAVGDPAVVGFERRVRAAVDAGFAVLGWIEES